MTEKRRTKPPHEPTDKTRAEVEALKSFGVPQSDIARYIGIDPKTLRLHYRDEIDNAQTKANATVARFLYQAASGKALDRGAGYADCIRAAMFWAKTRMQWRETDRPQDEEAPPLEVTFNVSAPVDSVKVTKGK